MEKISNNKPWYRMSTMNAYILNFMARQWENRYYCYGLFRANKINVFLLYAILPVAIIGCYVMFQVVPEDDRYVQWDVNFIADSVQKFFMAMMIHLSFKKTRHAGMATAVLIYFIFDLFYSIKGVYLKMWWFSLGFKLMLSVMVLFVIERHLRAAKRIQKKVKADNNERTDK
jgi:hypothetical protein